MNWSPNLAEVANLLAGAGFDVDAGDIAPHGGGSVTGRRDRGLESTLIAIDASGRIRLSIVQEREPGERQRLNIGNADLNLVVTRQRTLTVTGHLTSIDELVVLISLSGAALANRATERFPDRSAGQADRGEQGERPWWARLEAGDEP